jgi:ribonuclease BN (tRNA processing enzyme)
MKLNVLGCGGSESPDIHPPAFLLDDFLLLDAGVISAVLSPQAQQKITHILLSHAHHDHVRGLPSFFDNLIVAGQQDAVQVIAGQPTLQAVSDHLFNNLIWPDFSRLPRVEAPILRWQSIAPGRDMHLGDYVVSAFAVNHSVPTLAFRIQHRGVSLVYASDMGPTPGFWREIGQADALIVEVSFPDQLEALALKTGHLTPALLAAELDLLPKRPDRIFVTHLKAFHAPRILEEIDALNIPELIILQDGQQFDIEATRR